MLVQISSESTGKIALFRGLTEEELSTLTDLAEKRTFEAGDLCQADGQPTDRIYFILKGRLGVEFQIPNISYSGKNIMLDTYGPGDMFGWSALIKAVPWSTLRAVEKTETIYISAAVMLDLCEKNNHLGYVVMKNLAQFITTRLKRNRMTTLNAIVAIKGGW